MLHKNVFGSSINKEKQWKTDPGNHGTGTADWTIQGKSKSVVGEPAFQAQLENTKILQKVFLQKIPITIIKLWASLRSEHYCAFLPNNLPLAPKPVTAKILLTVIIIIVQTGHNYPVM